MAQKPVNFLYFITDQHRADYLGCGGHPVLKTPHIDSIAAGGTRFDRFYVANPVCMPNRAALMTGRMTSINGVRHNGLPLPSDANTFVDVLRAAGYATALVGKSHLRTITEIAPLVGANPAGDGGLSEARRSGGDADPVEEPPYWRGRETPGFPAPYYGFDHVDLVTDHGDQTGGAHLHWLRRKLGDPGRFTGEANQLPHDYVCPQAVRTALPEDCYSTSYIRDRAVDWLESRRGSNQPFFAFVSFPDPHHPFTPPGRYWDMYDPANMTLPDNFHRHDNPPPTLQWLRREYEAGTRPFMAQNAFMADERSTREAMALTCGMIAMIDDAVGAVLAKLAEIGRDGDTVVVFNSDHGDFMGDHGLLLKGPMHFQPLVRVPFLWKDPQRATVAATSALASTVDVARTILSRAGLTPYNGMQGTDLGDALAGRNGAREAVLIEDDANKVFLGFDSPPRLRTLVTERHRLSVYLDADWGELYDLRDDPLECRNLFDDPAYEKVRATLMRLLANELMRAADRSPWPRRVA